MAEMRASLASRLQQAEKNINARRLQAGSQGPHQFDWAKQQMSIGTTLFFIFAGIFMSSAIIPPLFAKFDKDRYQQPPPAPAGPNPSIDIIVPAYLEAGVIKAKIADLRNELQGYPGTARIVVAASDPQTAQAASEADLVMEGGRSGKAAAVNEAVKASVADVVMLTDANCSIRPTGWIGVALSELESASLVSAQKTETNGGDGIFWAYENWLKRSTGDGAGSLAVVGEFFATRRVDYREVRASAVCDDFVMAFGYYERGLKVAVSRKIVTVEPATSGAEQWERRIRIAEGVIKDILPRTRSLFREPIGRRYLAHKTYRNTVGCAAFWAAVLVTPFISIYLGVATWIGVLVAVLGYAGRMPISGILAGPISIVGMQAVMPIALLTRVLGKKAPASGALWRKVAR